MVILSKSFPMVRVEYEYDKFFLKAPLTIVDGTPLAVKAGIYLVDSLENPILTRVFQIGEKIEFMLPRNLMLDSPSTPIFKLEVTGDEYDPFITELVIPEDGNLTLESIIIKLRELIIEGQVLTRSNNLPMNSALVELRDSTSTVAESITDWEGNFRFGLPGAEVEKEYFDILVDTDGLYLPEKKRIFVEGEKYHYLKVTLGGTKELLELGVQYRVNQNRVPLREGPENGAPIKFFLGRGEPFVVAKTAGDRVFGYIETLNEKKNYRTQEEGWVLLKHLDLVQ